MILLALAIIFPTSPASRLGGHPGAMASPGDAPVKVKLSCAQAACAIAPKARKAAPVRYVGTDDESTEIVVPAMLIPMPALYAALPPPPVAFTTQDPDCAEANVTVRLFRSVNPAVLGRIQAGGELLS